MLFSGNLGIDNDKGTVISLLEARVYGIVVLHISLFCRKEMISSLVALSRA